MDWHQKNDSNMQKQTGSLWLCSSASTSTQDQTSFLMTGSKCQHLLLFPTELTEF